MKCHYCGAENARGIAYCLNCGTRQEQNEARKLPEPEIMKVEISVPVAPVSVVTEKEAEEAFPVIRPAARTAARPAAPRVQLPTKRGLGKMIFLGILTAGIYPTVIWSRMVAELNIAASRYDGERTVSYFGMLMLAPITLGIFPLVWIHNFCHRIGQELRRRRIDYKFGPRTFWLWGVLGALIIVGPFIYCHKLMQAMNRLNADFNING